MKKLDFFPVLDFIGSRGAKKCLSVGCFLSFQYETDRFTSGVSVVHFLIRFKKECSGFELSKAVVICCISFIFGPPGLGLGLQLLVQGFKSGTSNGSWGSLFAFL